MIFYIYNVITTLLLPIYLCLIFIRLCKHKELFSRIGERFAFTDQARAEGFLIWVHAASVGESIAALTIIAAINNLKQNCHFLITSGTTSSAQILAKKLPQNAIHQFLPNDNIIFVKKFLSHWQPNLAIFIESELWPCLLNETAKKNCPILLLNARISDRSFLRWQKTPALFKNITAKFDQIITQSSADLKKFQSLGVNAINLGNIKFANQKLAVDYMECDRLKRHLNDKRIIVAASTHSDDELAIMPLIRELRKDVDCCLIIVPRHPERKKEIAKMALNLQLSFTMRSTNSLPKLDDDLYIVDNFGEIGLFYNLADIIFVGGSFNFTGHNPIEPAHFGKIVLFGPDMSNFRAIADDMVKSKAAIQVADQKDLLAKLRYFLGTVGEANGQNYQINSINFVNQYAQVLTLYLNVISQYL